MIQSAAKQALHHARETLNQRIDLVESDSARHLLRMAAWAADNIGRLQCKLPGGWRFNAALSTLQNLFVHESLVPLAMPPGHASAAFCTDCHRDCTLMLVQNLGQNNPGHKENTTTPMSSGICVYNRKARE